MHRALSSVPTLSVAGALLAPVAYIHQQYSMHKYLVELNRGQRDHQADDEEDESRQHMSWLEFGGKVYRLLQLGMGKREVIGMIVFCCLFVVRSWVTLRRLNAESRVMESFAVGARRHSAVLEFVLSSLLVVAVESTTTNMRFWLIASLRETLSKSFHKRLMERDRFARANYEPECDAAQAIPSYCGEFAEHLAELPLYFLSPAADCAAALTFMWRSHGGHGARVLTAATIAGLMLIRKLQPDVARMQARVVLTESSFARRHYTVQTDAEPISMGGGSSYFFEVLNRYLHHVYAASCRAAAGTANFFFLFRVMDLALWDVIPLALWLRDGTLRGDSAVRGLVLQRSAARAFTKSAAILFKNIREVDHLREYTHKLSLFLASLSMVDIISNSHDPAVEPPRVHFATPSIVADVSDVEIRTPANVTLMQNFSLRITEGDMLMIAGPNGTGKTSLIRVLCGLWPVASGRVRVAKNTKVMCIPQQSFHLRKATLREQLWFPARPSATELPDEFEIAARSIKLACLDVIVDLIGGWSSTWSGFADFATAAASAARASSSTEPPPTSIVRMPATTNATAELSTDGYPWHSLSGGQKQKLAMARLFFTILMDQLLLERANPRFNNVALVSPTASANGGARRSNEVSSATTRRSPPSAAAAAAAQDDDEDMDDEEQQQQRLTIRKQQRRRYLVLLDEATSQVDGDAEEKIIKTLKAVPLVTIMCISHRKEMAQHANRILLLSADGRPPVVLDDDDVKKYLSAGRGAALEIMSPSTPMPQ